MKIFKYTFLMLSILALTSCDEEGSDDPFFGEGVNQTLIGFNDQTADFSIQIDETETFEVTLNSTILSSSDRTISITIDEASTLDPAYYSLSSTAVTIPANEYFGSLMITITDPLGEVVDPTTLILNILESTDYLLGGSSSIAISAGVDCPFVYEEIPEGLYDVLLLDFSDFFGETSTTRTVTLGPDANQVTINEGEFPIEGSEPLIFTLDELGNVIAINEDGLAFGNGPVSQSNGFPANFYALSPTPGTVLSCIGLFELGLNFTPFNGNPHSFQLRFRE